MGRFRPRNSILTSRQWRLPNPPSSFTNLLERRWVGTHRLCFTVLLYLTLTFNKLTVVTVTHKGCHGPSRVIVGGSRAFTREERILFPSCPRHHNLRSRRHDLVECDSQLTFHSSTRLYSIPPICAARLAQSVERKALITLGESHLVVGGSSPPSGVSSLTRPASGLVVKFNVAIVEPRVRLPARRSTISGGWRNR